MLGGCASKGVGKKKKKKQQSLTWQEQEMGKPSFYWQLSVMFQSIMATVQPNHPLLNIFLKSSKINLTIDGTIFQLL